MKKRIKFVDVAKGITMFMVVWGHTATNAELASANPPTLSLIMYSVHMPLFFFLSGLSFSVSPMKNGEDWRYFFKKNVLTLVFPYLIWALIYCAFSPESVEWILYGSWYALGQAATLTSLWYLTCLFVSRIMTEVFVSIIGNYTNLSVRKSALAAGVLLIAIGANLPKISIGYPWCFDVAFVATGCILLGVGLKKPLIALSVQKISVLRLLLLGCVAVYVVAYILRGDTRSILLMCNSQYGSGTGVVINAVAGGFAVLLLSMITMQLSEKFPDYRLCDVYAYIGEYTMGVFLLHKPMMQMLIMPLLRNCFDGFISEGIIKFVSAVVAMVISLMLCNVISHYVPELIGIFSKEKLVVKRKQKTLE